MRDQLSRRDALLRGGLAVAGLGAAMHPGVVWATRRPVVGVTYRLQATDQCSCLACQRHAENKLFATRAAADHCRAHPGCRCAVTRAAPISKGDWLELFGPASELHRTSVDRRWTSTRRMLKGARGESLTQALLPGLRRV